MIAEQLLKRFTLPDSDEAIAKIIEKPPRPIENLCGYDVAEACKLIEAAMKETYTPTTQIVRTVREIIGIARAYISLAYSTDEQFRAKCNMENIVPTEPVFATALIGLGGTGKSQIFRAIERLLSCDGGFIDLPGLPRYPIEPVWIMTMVAGKCLSSLLEPFVGTGMAGAAILKPAAKRAYTNGVGLTVLDESQFITATQGGHAKAAEVVMKTTFVGPPLVYGANFSMINKLEKRPQQERDRLLSSILVLNPEKHGSEDFGRILKAQLDVLSEMVVSDKAVSVKEHAEHIHNYTYGINRKSAILLNLATRIAREQGSVVVTFCHIEQAYRSDAYTSHREEVGLLRKQVLENKMARADLWCRYVPPVSSNVVVASSMIEEKEKRVAKALTRSMMTKSERDAYDAVTNSRTAGENRPAKVVRFPKADKSLEALQAASASLMAEFDAPG